MRTLSLFFSFVIVAKNEMLMLPKCITSIFKQKYNKDCYEIIVIDDYSTDDTSKLARNLGVKVITPDLPPKKTTRAHNKNFAATICKGEYIIFLDAHMILPSDKWLSSLENYIVSNDLQLVSGPAIPPPHLMPVMNYLPLANLKDIFLAMPQTSKVFNGGNMAISKKLMNRINGFPNLLVSEDLALYEQAIKIGINYKSIPELYLFHLDYKLSSISSWLKRSLKESYYARVFSRKHTKFDRREYYLYVYFAACVVLSIFLYKPLFIPLSIVTIYLGFFGIWLRRLVCVANKLSKKISIKESLLLCFFGATQAFMMLFSGMLGSVVHVFRKINHFLRKN